MPTQAMLTNNNANVLALNEDGSVIALQGLKARKALFNALVDVNGTVGVSGLVAPLGNVKFPAVQQQVADANTLDDYEEGTWVPATINVPGIVTVQSANYRKTGALVYVQAQLVFSATLASAPVQLNGLPFPQRTGTMGALAIGYTNAPQSGDDGAGFTWNAITHAMVWGGNLNFYKLGNYADHSEVGNVQVMVSGYYLTN